MLEIKDLSIQITAADTNFLAVDNISLTIEAGEVLALIGETGSGKSMTALSIMRLLPKSAAYLPNSRIEIYGNNLIDLTESEMRKIRGRDIGMIFQDPMTSLNPVMTVGKQITEALSLHVGLTGRECYIAALRLLDAVQIPDAVNRFNAYPHELSGGMKQRIMIAIALAAKPNLLIADEPTTALDVTTQAEILVLLQEIQQQNKMALLLITHDLAVAAQMADKIAVMRNGKIVEQNYSDKFFNNPQHEYSKLLLENEPTMFDRNLSVASSNSEKLLAVRDLKVHFPIRNGIFRKTVGYVKAVDGVDFDLHEGETLAIVGESGCGKTSVARAILSLTTATDGSISYQSQNLLKLNSRQWRKYRSQLQMVFQDPYSALDPKMRLIDSLQEGLLVQNKSIKAKQLEDMVDNILLQVGLSADYKYRYPHQLSGGERQRMCIARALILRPNIVVCDEPTSSLDVSVQAQILKLLRQVQQDFKISYLFISHDLTVVSNLAHRILVMYLGRVVESGLTADVLTNPKHPYTQALLAAVPKMSKSIKANALLTGDLPSPADPPSGCHFHPRCKFAKPSCRVAYPKNVQLSATHSVSCILYAEELVVN